MQSKLYIFIVAVLFAFVSLLYFSFNSSYQKSLQSRWYYFIGEYEYALELANEALEIEPYNKMAMTVATQSKTSLKFVRYNKQGEEYLNRIEELVSKDVLSKKDKIRIKFMCDIMIEQYPSLVATVLTDKDLKAKSYNYYMQFKKLHEKITEVL